MKYNTWKHYVEIFEGLQYEYWIRDNKFQKGTYQAIVHDPFDRENVYQCNILAADMSRAIIMHEATSLAGAKQWFKTCKISMPFRL